MLKLLYSMKILLLLYFALTMPSIILLATFLYGGLSPEVLKISLANEKIYEKINDRLVSGMVSSDSDSDSVEMNELLNNRLTPSYLQTKTESFIDTSNSWITGKSTASPVISFKELKDDITSQNPELLSNLNEVQKNVNLEDGQEKSPDTDALTTLLKSDFTFNIENYLSSLRLVYIAGKILLPLHILLLLIILIILWLKSQPLTNRLKWIGTTLLTTSSIGYANIILSSFFLVGLNETIGNNSNEYISIFFPLIATIFGKFFETYKEYQVSTNIAFLILGIMFLIFGFITKQATIITTKANKKAK